MRLVANIALPIVAVIVLLVFGDWILAAGMKIVKPAVAIRTGDLQTLQSKECDASGMEYDDTRRKPACVNKITGERIPF